eukprot:3316479-Rhodomonas_salina.1
MRYCPTRPLCHVRRYAATGFLRRVRGSDATGLLWVRSYDATSPLCTVPMLARQFCCHASSFYPPFSTYALSGTELRACAVLSCWVEPGGGTGTR